MSSRDTSAGCDVRTRRLLLSQEQNVPTYFFTITEGGSRKDDVLLRKDERFR